MLKFYFELMETLVLENLFKLLCLYLVQHIMLHQIKSQQIYTDLGLYQLCLILQKNSRIQGLFRDFPVLFKADLIFKDFSRKPSKFKYFSSLC